MRESLKTSILCGTAVALIATGQLLDIRRAESKATELLIEAERRNAFYHARSIDDRAALKLREDALERRMRALETRVRLIQVGQDRGYVVP